MKMLSSLLAIGFALVAIPQWSLISDADAVIIEPQPGALIETRGNFRVAWSIVDFTQERVDGWHYWVSVANRTGSGRPALHWPKMYVKKGQAFANVSDCGTNPYREPQRMYVLLLRIDDSVDQQFTAWLRRGEEENDYPGLLVQENQVVARVPVLFPY